MQQETDELWRILLAATSDTAALNTTCVLDALDECNDKDRGDLIAKLTRFHGNTVSQDTRPSWLKFIVTSRPYDDIQRGFQQTPLSLPIIRLRGEHEDDQIQAEINRVIHVRVSQLANELGLRESTSRRIEQTMLEMKHRTYLWLHLAIDNVRKTLQNSFKPEEEAIESVPPSVESAYEKILTRVDRTQYQSVKLILQIIVGARRPLTVSEMALALGLAITKQCRTSADAQLDPAHLGKQLRHWCGLFVFVNQSRIYLIHQTAREFLIARQEAGHSRSSSQNTWRHCIQQAEMEQTMTSICVRCLNLKHREISASQELTPDILVAIEGRKGFIDYCCEWWTTHHNLSQDASEGIIRQNVLALYNTQGKAFRFWFDRFWRKSRYHVGEMSMTPIRVAVLNNHDRILQHFIGEMGSDIEAADDAGRTALYWASESGYDKILKLLLDNGANINAQGGKFGNALQAASAEGHDRIVQMLLESGADVNARGGIYGNALQAASVKGHNKILHMLYNAGADLNSKGGQYGRPLLGAIVVDKEKVVQFLLEKGADANAEDWYRGNALQLASGGGQQTIVQMLLDRGADCNARGRYRGNALYIASANGYTTIVQMLLEKGAVIDIGGGPYGNALHVASAAGYEDLVQVLLERGANIEAQGHYGNALCTASAMGQGRIVQMLLDRGADADAPGGKHGSPLQTASRGNHETVMHILLKGGARPSVEVLIQRLSKHDDTIFPPFLPYLKDIVFERDADHGKTLLHWAAELGNTSLLTRCRDLGADVNAMDRYGKTALHYAAENGHLDIVQILVQENADKTISDSHGRTALDFARGYGPGSDRRSHPDIVAYLSRTGMIKSG